jgi:hypothetical protein
MKNSAAIIVFLLIFGLFQAVFAQNVPTKIKAYLKANYPDWEITKGCMEESKSFVSGDYDGNGKTDYAVAIHKDKRDYTLALIAIGKAFKAYSLRGITHDEQGKAMANLGVLKKDENIPAERSFRLKTDSVIVADCDSYSEVYYWDNGKFANAVVH